MKNKWLVILCAAVTAIAVSLSGCAGKDKNTDKGKGGNITGSKTVEREKNPVPEEYEEDACGEKITWNYDKSSGTLTVTGDGEMWDYIRQRESSSFYDKADTPWEDYDVDTVIIADGVERIGDYAFEKCIYLYTVEFPDSVTSIGDYAFSDCSFLDKVKLPDGLTEIGERAFEGCFSISGIDIPDSVISIGDYAFTGCGNSFFKSIDIPASVEYIGHESFSGSSIENINVDANNKNYSSVDGVLFNKDKTEIIYYPRGKTVKEYIIPDGVVKIGYGAFEGNSSLENIEIPHSVTEIGDYAFNGPPLKSINIPDSVTKIGDGAFRWDSTLEEIVIPEGVKIMGDYIFAYAKPLKKVTLPESLESIGKRVFFSTSIEEIHFGGTKEQWEALGIQPDTISETTIIFGK